METRFNTILLKHVDICLRAFFYVLNNSERTLYKTQKGELQWREKLGVYGL
ncbi:MAG: hypothetical protein K0S51_1638 [Bacillales bacterium]|jgi:hypothetical protein|nr:hypothetical protein [Bacillales bacterium]